MIAASCRRFHVEVRHRHQTGGEDPEDRFHAATASFSHHAQSFKAQSVDNAARPCFCALHHRFPVNLKQFGGLMKVRNFSSSACSSYSAECQRRASSSLQYAVSLLPDAFVQRGRGGQLGATTYVSPTCRPQPSANNERCLPAVTPDSPTLFNYNKSL